MLLSRALGLRRRATSAAAAAAAAAAARRLFEASSSSSSSSATAAASFADGAETGLYGLPILRTATGFRRFVDEAIERSNELVSNISRLPPSMEIIRAMDEISNTVCSVIDSAELCRNTHPDREYVEEADKASMRIYEYLHFLNTNVSLYNAILKAESEGVLLTEEAQRAASTLRIDFEKGGIHLSEEKLDRVNELNLKAAQLGRKFNENIMIDPGFVDIYPASRIPKGMQHHFKSIYWSTESASEETRDLREQKREKGLRITTDSSTLSSVLKWVSDAEIMGYKSFADFAIHPNLAAKVDVVTSFLLDLSKIVRPKADEEFARIRDFKRRVCNEKSVDLEPWDEAYFTGVMRSSTYDLDSSVVASYFPLSKCLEGLKLLVESLFGATFQIIPTTPSESWHPDVLKLSLHHPEEGDLGYLYLDLYSRKGKYPGCAHFAIRGGRRVSDTEYQLPV